MRTRLLIRVPALAGALCVVLAVPASAQMSIAEKVLADYAADGILEPCKHSSEELRLVQKNIPPDFEQYAPDYPAAVAAALEARARGDCAGKKPQKAVVPAATSTPAPTPQPTPVPTAIPTKTVVPEPPEPEKLDQVTPTATATPDAAEADPVLERVATARAANDAPAPVLLLAALGGLLGLFALMLVTMRRMGWEDGRLAPVAHAWREASFRTGGLWEDFRDWLRVGR